MGSKAEFVRLMDKREQYKFTEANDIKMAKSVLIDMMSGKERGLVNYSSH